MFGSNSNTLFSSNGQKNNQGDQQKDIKIINDAQLPTDTVEVLKFSKNSSSKLFASGDWSGNVAVYDIVSSNNQTGIVQKLKANVNSPIFDLQWTSNSEMIIVACADGTIKALQLSSLKYQNKMMDNLKLKV